MPEETALLEISVHGFNQDQEDDLTKIMHDREFWFWERDQLPDGKTKITSKAFADTDENADKLDELVAAFRDEFTPVEIDMSKRNTDDFSSIYVPTSFVYEIDIK